MHGRMHAARVEIGQKLENAVTAARSARSVLVEEQDAHDVPARLAPARRGRKGGFDEIAEHVHDGEMNFLDQRCVRVGNADGDIALRKNAAAARTGERHHGDAGRARSRARAHDILGVATGGEGEQHAWEREWQCLPGEVCGDRG